MHWAVYHKDEKLLGLLYEALVKQKEEEEEEEFSASVSPFHLLFALHQGRRPELNSPESSWLLKRLFVLLLQCQLLLFPSSQKQTNKDLCLTKLTNEGNSILHLAVTSPSPSLPLLTDILSIQKEGSPQILSLKNKYGHTAKHVATDRTARKLLEDSEREANMHPSVEEEEEGVRKYLQAYDAASVQIEAFLSRLEEEEGEGGSMQV